MSKKLSITGLRKRKNKGLMLALLFIIFSGAIYLPMSCKKVDDTIDKALNFDGLFTSSDGWEIDLSGTAAKITKVGTPRGSTSPGVGDYTMAGMSRTSNNSWKGTVLDETFENSVSGTATISGNTLTVKPDGYPSFSFTKGTTSTTGTSTVTGTGTVTATGADTVLDKYVDGSVKEPKYYYYTVGSGVKKLEIITTEGMTDDGKNATHNTADLFVSVDPNKPTVTSSPYSWTAEKSSTNINRVSEYCAFTNPSGGTLPSGKKYNILIYDNNTFFISRLVVIVTK